jgi:uncharacterized protein (UPF0276 family)
VVVPSQETALPAEAGIGAKPAHHEAILADSRPPAFVEVHAENFLGAGGAPHAWLRAVRERLPLSIHGVGLSLGSDQPLDERHLSRVAALVEHYQPQSFSEHLAWSSHGQNHFNDLLPLAYDQRSLQRVCEHVGQVQDRLRRRILIENPATYVEFEASTIAEADFLAELVRRSGCGLLLDVNNAYVSCINHGRDVGTYLASLPLSAVAEIHLAGYTRDRDGSGAELLIDSHGCAVAEPVWALYAALLSAARRAADADRVGQRGAGVCGAHGAGGQGAGVARRASAGGGLSQATGLPGFAETLLDPRAPIPAGLRTWNGSDPARRFDVHRNNVVTSLTAALAATFPVVLELVGADFFQAMAREFVRAAPPASPVLAEYGEAFADFVAGFRRRRACPTSRTWPASNGCDWNPTRRGRTGTGARRVGSAAVEPARFAQAAPAGASGSPIAARQARGVFPVGCAPGRGAGGPGYLKLILGSPRMCSSFVRASKSGPCYWRPGASNSCPRSSLAGLLQKLRRRVRRRMRAWISRRSWG